MTKFSLIPFFLFLIFNVKAQDKIICINNDTIHCTIRSISNERIMYELKDSNGSVTGRFIALSLVAEYSRSSQLEISSKKYKLKSPKPAYIPENPFCLGLKIGRSNMPWYFDHVQSSYALPDFYDKLKTGLHLDASAHYMIKSYFGLGVEYSFFKTSTSGSTQIEYLPSIFLMKSEKYRQYINYLGASVLFQQHLDAKRKFILSESLSAGVLFLRLENQNTLPNSSQSSYSDHSNNILLTGNSLSGKVGLTAEYRLIKAVSVGLGSDFIWSTLKKASFESKESNGISYTNNEKKLKEPMNLSRIDYSFVLHYYF